MDVVASLMRLAEELVSPENEFPEATLYHGSFLANLDSIRAHGIVPRIIDVKAAVMNAVDEVSIAFDLNSEQDKELRSDAVVKYALDRVEQSRFDKVYLSGEKDFAEGNAKAGGEWYEGIVLAAERIKHADYYDLKHDYAMRILAIEKQMKLLDEKCRGMMAKGDFDEYERISRQLSVLNEQYGEIQLESQRALNERRQEIKRQSRAIMSRRFGDKAVILTVVMPYAAFVSKIASASSRQRVETFEKMYAEYVSGEDRQNWFSHVRGDSQKVWEFFQEVHLSGVEPHYIKGWEIVN